MKVGIFTFHNPTNYGAAFQAYALRKTVSSLTDKEAEIVDYINPRISAAAQLKELEQNKTVKGIVKKIIALPYMKRKHDLFASFLKKHGCLSSIQYDCDTINACSQIYDTMIFGSDQIWNLHLTGFDWNYYGSFSKNICKIAYAGSMGNFDIASVAPEAKENLRDFSAISCRENKVCEELAEATGIEAAHVLDPTLLLTGDDWRKLKQPIKTPQQYILLYLISPKKDDFVFARQLAKKTGLPVLYVNYSYKQAFGVRNLGAVSPESFLYLLDNAKYVVTNSFHGTVLSINLHKDFYCQISAKKGKANLRVLEVVNRMGLADRCLFDDSEITENSVVDWNQVDQLLYEERSNSKRFLRHALEKNHEQTV